MQSILSSWLSFCSKITTEFECIPPQYWYHVIMGTPYDWGPRAPIFIMFREPHQTKINYM